MSKIEVDQVDPQSGTTLTLGTSGDTISIPAGVTLANSGTATGFASIAWQSTIVTTSTLTAVANEGYWIDTTSNACTITLPASANVGDQLIFSDYARTWGTNKITLNTNGLNFQGNQTTGGGDYPEYNTDGQSVTIIYSGATQGWIPTVDDDVTYETPQTYDIDFLVVAGGGGSGSAQDSSEGGGGGGAGGFRTSTQAVPNGSTITVTVGDGGAGGINQSSGTSGNSSSITGSGLTTITSAGGGGGGAYPGATYPGVSGGSGGGGADGSAGGSGNTPSTSPSQGNNGGSASAGSQFGAGGGGANAVGNPTAGSNGGNGGAGTASSITGSSVTYAGGGGGGGTTGGSGGAGGGGNGSTGNGVGVVGTVNLGGGGGGGFANGASQNGSAGGKGVVILSMLDADYSGTTTGSPTVATGVSGKTVLTFTGTGSYTA
jgi:hypothetical protein